MVQKSHSQPPFGCFRKPVNNEIFTISTGEFAGFLVAINSMYCFVNSILWSQRWRVITNGLGEKFSGRIRDGRGAAQQSGKSQVIGFGFSVRNWEWQWPKLAGGNSKIFYFHPLFGEDEPILTNIFQLGWNHQPEKHDERKFNRWAGPLQWVNYWWPPSWWKGVPEVGWQKHGRKFPCSQLEFWVDFDGH